MALFVTLGLLQFTVAAPGKEARLTEVIHDVNLLAARSAARPAAVNDTVREGTTVRTGSDSRAEMTFADETLTRLGANTVFSFGSGPRAYDLGSGAVLLSAPQGAGTVRINTPAVTAAVTGFTAILERHAHSPNKFILLHGTGTLTFKRFPADSCRLHSGQMVVYPPNPTRLPQVVDVDLSKLLAGKLIRGFKRKLPEFNLIWADIEKQKLQSPSPVLVDPTSLNTIDQAITARPPPSKSRVPGGKP